MIVEPLTGKAKQAIGHQAAMVALEGSVRSGKTWASLTDWVDYCLTGPDGDFLMAGRTQRTVEENLVLPLQRWCGERLVKLNRGTGTVIIAGRRCRIVGANDEAAQTKIQGPTFAGAYIDEASTLPQSFFNMARSRLSVEGARMWLTSNPEAPAHWLKTEWLDRARLWIDRDGIEHVNPDGIDLVRVSFKLEDNPNLPQSYVDEIKRTYTGLWYRRYILGEWCIAAGAVFEDWDPARHVVHEVPPVTRVVALGIDYGTTHPTRGYLLGITTDTPRRLVLLDEWAPARATDAGLSVDLRRWLSTRRPEWQQPEWVCVDPAAASFRLQLETDGLPTMAAHNRVLSGIRTVASLLAMDRLVVADTCKHLIAKLPGYSWDPKATARGEDEPIKADDDEVDAMRYGIASTRAIWGMYVPMSLPAEEAA